MTPYLRLLYLGSLEDSPSVQVWKWRIYFLSLTLPTWARYHSNLLILLGFDWTVYFTSYTFCSPCCWNISEHRVHPFSLLIIAQLFYLLFLSILYCHSLQCFALCLGTILSFHHTHRRNHVKSFLEVKNWIFRLVLFYPLLHMHLQTALKDYSIISLPSFMSPC